MCSTNFCHVIAIETHQFLPLIFWVLMFKMDVIISYGQDKNLESFVHRYVNSRIVPFLAFASNVKD